MSLYGCSMPPQPAPNVPFQENLKTKCPAQLPRINGTSGAYVAGALLDYQILYAECAARHNALADEINKRENIYHGKN
nr:hypothetical protein [Siccibacter turicensis]